MLKALILLTLFAPFPANAKEQKALVVCPLKHLSAVKKTVEANGDLDKFKHCAISCLLTLRCNSADVMELGVYKEVIDIFGPGNAEYADLQADMRGIGFAKNKKAKTDSECMTQCHLVYPESMGNCRKN